MAFGPTFESELSAAGLRGLPFSWGSDGAIFGAENLSEEDAQKLAAVVAAHDPNATLPAPVPESISDRQFFQQLALSNIITTAEALAAVKTGDIPAALVAIVNAMPADQQFDAEMLLSGATVFQRSHPMTAVIGTAYGWSEGQIDAFFRTAAAL